MAMDRIHNHNESITQASLAGAFVPAVIPCSPKKCDGRTLLPVAQEVWDKTGGDIPFQDVRVIPKTCLAMFIDPKQRAHFQREYGPVGEGERKRLLYLIALAQAVREHKGAPEQAAAAFDKAIRKLLGITPEMAARYDELWGGPDENSNWLTTPAKSTPAMTDEEGEKGYALEEQRDFWREHEQIFLLSAKFPALELMKMLNHEIRSARLVMWWSIRDKKIMPGVYCRDLATALFALALVYSDKPTGLAACLRCGTMFSKHKGGHNYCSHSCQTAAAQMRYRARTREREVALIRQSKHRKQSSTNRRKP